MPYPQDLTKSQDNVRFENFVNFFKIFACNLVDAIKMPPYSEYMKYIVSNKRKNSAEAVTTMLTDYFLKENC
jgi:hypothetical protein